MKKKCFKCLDEKDITEFYKHKKMADGYLGKCKECTKKDSISYRNENIERCIEYDKKRNMLPHRKAARIEYSKTEAGKLASLKSMNNWRRNNPLKRATNMILYNAVRSGKIKKSPCSCCGSKIRIHGHHEDYYKPLDVIWLCGACHNKLHNLKKRDK